MNGFRPVFPFFLLLFLFPAFLFANSVSDIVGDTFEETQGRGLAIRTNPAGVKVFIDGVERGLTPITFDNIEPGEHYVKLEKEGYRDRYIDVVLFNNSRLAVSIEMEILQGFAQISIFKEDGSPEHLPFNPQVFINMLDRTSPESSLSHDNKLLVSLPAGYNTIRARAFGWEETTLTIFVDENSIAQADIPMIPAAFKMEYLSQSRRRFSPANSSSLGSTEIRFEVTAPGDGTVTVMDKDGNVVYEKHLNNFSTWMQSVTWNGRDSGGNPVPEGLYTILITAQDIQIKTETEIDYSLVIFPVSLSSGMPGLAFAPVPNVLPAGSYQITADILYGNFLPSEKSDKESFMAFSFAIGMRVTPFKKFESFTVFNINPNADGAGWGITGSVKYNFLDGGSFPIALAAGVSYAWADKNGEAPLSAGRGAGIYVPLSVELKKFSIIFSPSVFFHGAENIKPALHLGAGVLYRDSWFNAGISARAEFNFQESKASRFFTGAEGRFYPFSSNFVFSAQGGMWAQGSQVGAYGGIGIGIIY